LEQIAIAIERINRISQQNLTNTRSIESLSTGLARLGSELRISVGEVASPIATSEQSH
jgi:hypothetical protein